MYRTKRSLIQENNFLRRQLEEERTANKAKEESGFAECKGDMCYSCAHAVWKEISSTCRRMIGCDVECVCKDYSRLANAGRSFSFQRDNEA